VLQILINDIKSDTICVPKYKISMTKSLVLIKLIVIINLLMVKVVFTIVSFMREIFLCFINVFIVKCRKRYRINMWLKIQKGTYKKRQKNCQKMSDKERR
jgi:hypothetical protein